MPVAFYRIGALILQSCGNLRDAFGQAQSTARAVRFDRSPRTRPVLSHLAVASEITFKTSRETRSSISAACCSSTG